MLVVVNGIGNIKEFVNGLISQNPETEIRIIFVLKKLQTKPHSQNGGEGKVIYFYFVAFQDLGRHCYSFLQECGAFFPPL